MIIPVIGAEGKYELLEPYQSYLDPNANYICQSIRYIGEYIANNDSPYKLAYEKYQRPYADYEKDIQDKIPIVALQSGIGHWIYVPATHIKSWPDVLGVSCHGVKLSVTLGIMPSDYNYNPIKDEIKNLIESILGITPVIEPVQISKPLIVDYDKYNEITSLREQKKTNKTTLYGRYRQSLEDLDRTRYKLSELEQHVLSLKNNP